MLLKTTSVTIIRQFVLQKTYLCFTLIVTILNCVILGTAVTDAPGFVFDTKMAILSPDNLVVFARFCLIWKSGKAHSFSVLYNKLAKTAVFLA